MRRVWAEISKWRVVAPLIRHRSLTLMILFFAAVQIGTSLAGFQIWQCYWKKLTGFRCPGCGMTSGCKAALRGDFGEAFQWNWLAPFVVIGCVFLAVGISLPKSLRKRLTAWVWKIEGVTRFALLLLIFAIFQVVARVMGWA